VTEPSSTSPASDPGPDRASPYPPDPTAYDSPRAVRARAKGLDAPYIAGGDDPDIGPALAEERRFWRLLVVMVVTIVGAGFIIGTILALLGPTSGS
jgi:hypothetical protein